MFKKVLVANRGVIAVRVVRALRDMGIWSVALYEAGDRGSLHVRLADECYELTSPLGYMDGAEILDIARRVGADAIHPGYGFLAERADFIRACEEAGIVFIGPPSEVVAGLSSKIGALERAQRAGLAVAEHSSQAFRPEDFDLLEAEAEALGFPLIIKACAGGRGRATRVVRSPKGLKKAVEQAHAEAKIVFGDDRLFLERAILPCRFIDVQLLGDRYGNLVHLGERDGSLQRYNQKLLAEAPAPNLTAEQRSQVLGMALDIARLFNFQGVGTIEFLMDREGQFYFSEIKPRIQVEHPVTEMVTRVDLVKEQIELAAGKRLTLRQEDVRVEGWAMQCRINAEDPWNNFLPSPGVLRRFRLPGGPNVRVDTYGYSGCEVPVRYDPILAKVAVWGQDRSECLNRLRRALQDFAITGLQTNLPLYQRILDEPEFIRGEYTTQLIWGSWKTRPAQSPPELLRDLAVAAAIAYVMRHRAVRPTVPERFQSGWHRSPRW
ncbi:MAG: ATP-grasp domain-containing protein [Caldilineales bacterium]|nr:ATP-grasp domain-containing protein [Caldilineales bacterium]MDW8316861.1 biotin carboxylase N-terminal domain-containing protein [Anaerolineae bacterium]